MAEKDQDFLFGYSLAFETLWSLTSSCLEMVAMDRKRRALENKTEAQQKSPVDRSFCIIFFNC